MDRLLYISGNDERTGDQVEVEGVSLEEVAAQLPDGGEQTFPVVDEAGFVIGYACNPHNWRYA
jgi:hypothetical protein